MGNILLIDDDPAFLKLLRDYVTERFPGLMVSTCSDPLKCLGRITAELDLLLVDLEMPGLDGSKILAYAVSKGLSKARIAILSGHDAEYLHQRFPMGSCLAVLNKHEAKQKEALDMIFASLKKKTEGRRPGTGNLCSLP
ncbi:MAG: response regulator [Nitrospiraceae bacterium]|nr:response regulator [Nitrospiraceae bacterium]